MTPVITMCHWNRPDYTRRSLAALRRCRNISEAILLPHVEPGCEEVIALCQAVDFCEVQVTVNPRRLDAPLNTVQALSHGFQHSSFVIHVEDDIILAPDALDYFLWAGRLFQPHPEYFSVTAFARTSDTSQPFATGQRSWFHPWGYGLWADRFAQVAGYMAAAPAYDPWLTHHWVIPRKLREVYPVLGRCQNIGERRSISDGSPAADAAFAAWQREHQQVPVWAGDQQIPPGDFRLPEVSA
jgi:hypothetical protein